MKILNWMIFYVGVRGAAMPIDGTNSSTRKAAMGNFARDCGKSWEQLSQRYKCLRVIVEVKS